MAELNNKSCKDCGAVIVGVPQFIGNNRLVTTLRNIKSFNLFNPDSSQSLYGCIIRYDSGVARIFSRNAQAA